MSNQELIAAAKAPVIAYNEKDWEAVRDATTADFVYDEVATGRRVEGIDDVLAVWRGWGEALPDSRATFHDAFVDGNDVILELSWRGTHTGVLRAPGGDIPPTGKEIDMRACQVVRVEGGKASSVRHYFDMLTMLTQLGVAPAESAQAAAG